MNPNIETIIRSLNPEAIIIIRLKIRNGVITINEIVPICVNFFVSIWVK